MPKLKEAQKLRAKELVNKRRGQTEKQFEDYIVANLPSIFCAITEKDLKSYKRQFLISPFIQDVRGLCKGIVDIKAEDVSGAIYLIEIKVPINIYESANGIIQLLVYKELFKYWSGKDAQAILLFDRNDPIIAVLMVKYKLPILFCYVDKGMVYKVISYEKK